MKAAVEEVMTGYRTKWMVAIGLLAVISMVSMAAACTNGHTPGFWGNKNGQALIGPSDLTMLQGLNLVGADGTAFDPMTKEDFKTWLREGDATNMAYMLSVQLAAMELNVENGFVTTGHYIFVSPLVESDGDGDGDAKLLNVLTEANAALAANGYTPAGDGDRAYQEALKNALDDANNNLNWV